MCYRNSYSSPYFNVVNVEVWEWVISSRIFNECNYLSMLWLKINHVIRLIIIRIQISHIFCPDDIISWIIKWLQWLYYPCCTSPNYFLSMTRRFSPVLHISPRLTENTTHANETLYRWLTYFKFAKQIQLYNYIFQPDVAEDQFTSSHLVVKTYGYNFSLWYNCSLPHISLIWILWLVLL